MVLGLITTVGTDVSGVIGILKDQLSHFHYEVEEVSVSQDVISQFESFPPAKGCSEFQRISHYMDLGNQVRQKARDNSILMKGVAAHLHRKREKDALEIPQPRKRVAYIIKSLKHPDEVDFMRDTYGDGFHLIGITSSYERRINYLKTRKALSHEQAETLLQRDANEDLKQGQHTRDAFQHADYFINLILKAKRLSFIKLKSPMMFQQKTKLFLNLSRELDHSDSMICLQSHQHVGMLRGAKTRTAINWNGKEVVPS